MIGDRRLKLSWAWRQFHQGDMENGEVAQPANAAAPLRSLYANADLAKYFGAKGLRPYEDLLRVGRIRRSLTRRYTSRITKTTAA